ncbi:MAG: tetratricopeptide repeat protein [Methylococcales bacterium]|nr:tetratricopeptide repeat protein [Methylococcales bacterium]
MASLKEQSEELFNLGLKCQKDGQFKNAIECYDKVIRLTDDELSTHRTMAIAAYVARGKCEQESKNYNYALDDYDSAIRLAGDSGEIELHLDFFDIYYNIGICEELKDYEMTSSEYKEIVEGGVFNPVLHAAEVNKVCCEMLERAVAEYSKAIELNPSFTDAYNHRGNCYMKLNAQAYRNYQFYEGLKSDYEFYLSDYKHYADTGAGNNHESFIYSKSCYERALYDYCKAIELNPRYADAYNNRKNFYDLALADFNKAIELNPSFADAYNNLGKYYEELKNYELAVANYSKSIELEPDDYWIYCSRIGLYIKQKSYGLALVDYAKAIKLKDGRISHRFFMADTDNSILNHIDNSIKSCDSSDDKKEYCFLAKDIAIREKEFDKAEGYIKKAFEYMGLIEQNHKDIYLQEIRQAKEIDKKNTELEETNKRLEAALEKEKSLHNALHEKEKEMLSFFTHTMRNALSSAPESLRQAIRLLGSEDYEKNKIHYEAINEITALFSTLSLVDCLVDTFKQSIYDPEKFKLNWEEDNTGEATPQWFIAAALRQSLNRIIFISNTRNLIKLLQGDSVLIKPIRKAFIEQVLPLDINKQGVESFYQWLNTIPAIDISIKEDTIQFGVNQIKFSLLFSITSELIFNALKYWDGTGQIQIRWFTEKDYYIFTVKNTCRKNASSNLAGTHQGLAFIKRLMELLDDKDIKTYSPAQFTCFPEEHTFTAELKLHKTLLENNS